MRLTQNQIRYIRNKVKLDSTLFKFSREYLVTLNSIIQNWAPGTRASVPIYFSLAQR